MLMKIPLLLLISLYHHFSPIFAHSLHTDKTALLQFKNSIKSDPRSSLANWNVSTSVCSFAGVKCGLRHARVVYLNLNSSGIVGKLSPLLSNLTQLHYLHLVENNFYGEIPYELSLLRNLIELKLSSNNFQGKIPASFSLLCHLKLVLLNDNRLSGSIPPAFFSNCTRLKNIDFSGNELGGTIPYEIGNCPDLWSVSLYSNMFVGQIPASLGNATGMLSLDVENNIISGELPAEIFSRFTELRYLHLSDNKLMSHDNNTNLDPFFTALTNCSVLDELELVGNGLGGSLPTAIGELSETLQTFQLQENRIHGGIPSEIGNLSSLQLLNLTSNMMSGLIPAEIGKLARLEQLFLSYNFFTEIPIALGKISIGAIDMSHNNLSGRIPEEVGIASLNFLFLNNNLLSGEIPSSIGKCSALLKLDLSYKRLSGRVPPEITGLREIRFFLNLSHNQLDGPLPIELSKLESVEEIDLSGNRFNGSVFSQISSCYALKVVNFSNNFIGGVLPESLGDLKSISVMDFSNNKLHGRVPQSLNRSKTLTFFNFSGNPKLCGDSIPGVGSCQHKHYSFNSKTFLIIFPLIIFISGFSSTICCVYGCPRFRLLISRTRTRSRKERKQQPTELTQNFPIITYKELLDATAGFDERRLVGSGSYGRVYRGSLPDGTQIAIKVLQLQSGNSTKSFNRECQVLKRIRHRNLIRIITACSLPEFKALVLPFMGNGSLEGRLYGQSDLSLMQRVNICSDIAEGMAYMHHHSPVKVIHCDLKPSNVLLNDDMTALVSDFGIARLVMSVEAGNGGGIIDNVGNSTANVLCGSIGYIAPEYGYGSSTSTKGDVYSFGVLVLEMVTRKRPTDEMLGEGMSLHKFVKNHHIVRMENVVDHTLLRALRNEPAEVMRMWEVAIGELIDLGLLCTQESPSMRPTMLDCADDLDRLKSYLRGDTTATFSSSLGISSSTFSDC